MWSADAQSRVCVALGAMASPLSACLTCLTCLACLPCLPCLAADGPALPPVYWSASNPGFASSKGGIVVYPRLGDKLDIVCPQIPTFPPTIPPTVRSFVKFGHAPGLATNSSRAWTATHSASIPPLGDADVPGEYYRLFLVSREAALRCDAGTATSALLTCNRPLQHVKYTLKFQEFSPSVVGLEFRDKHDYYIISTSTGTRHGLARLRGGVCHTHGMRLIMRVGQERSASSSGRYGGDDSSHSLALGLGVAGGCLTLLLILLIVTLALCGAWHRRRRDSTATDSSAVEPRPSNISMATSVMPLDPILPLPPLPKAGNNNRLPDASEVLLPLQLIEAGARSDFERKAISFGAPVFVIRDSTPSPPPPTLPVSGRNLYYRV